MSEIIDKIMKDIEGILHAIDKDVQFHCKNIDIMLKNIDNTNKDVLEFFTNLTSSQSTNNYVGRGIYNPFDE